MLLKAQTRPMPFKVQTRPMPLKTQTCPMPLKDQTRLMYLGNLNVQTCVNVLMLG